MALELKQGLKLNQSLVITPQLQQAIKLLQMGRMELIDAINQELAENPLLEETLDQSEGGETQADTHINDGDDYSSEQALDPESSQIRDEANAPGSSTAESDMGELSTSSSTESNTHDEFAWEQYLGDQDQYNSSGTAPSMREVGEEGPNYEQTLTRTSSLEEHLAWQLSMSELSDEEKELGKRIIGNLTPDGFLDANFIELCDGLSLDPEDAEALLQMIQCFDPLGVASRDLKECLMIQAKTLRPRIPLIETLIENHLKDLENRSYTALVKQLGVPVEELKLAVESIKQFEPRPGRNFVSVESNYITPDIYVVKVGNEFVVQMNEEGMPRLKLSPYYRDVLLKKSGSPKDPAKDYVQEKLRNATWLIRSLHNRQRTIFRVTEAIVARQPEFFEKGVQCLKPMILRDIASDVSLHESTISRVTTNKYVHTPVGLFELKYFFNNSVSTTQGDDLASEAVKQKIKKMIENEDGKNPLSDQKIVEILESEQIKIARRTIAKYRDLLGILPSSKRKSIT